MARRKRHRRDSAQIELPGLFQSGRSAPEAPNQFVAKSFEATEPRHVAIKFMNETIRDQFRKILRDSTQNVVCTVSSIEGISVITGVSRVPKALGRPVFPFWYNNRSKKWERRKERQ